MSDDQWQAAFDEDIRRFDFANKLGEFAVAASGGSGGGGWGYGGSGKGKAKDDDEDDNNKKGTITGVVKDPNLPPIIVPYRVDPDRYYHASY